MPEPKDGKTTTEGAPEPKAGEADSKIAELQKDSSALAEFLKSNRRLVEETQRLTAEVNKFEKAKKDAEDKALADQGKFKDLAEREKGEKAELQKKFSERAIVSELKTEALKAGILNSDDVALADRSSLKVDENFTVTGAAEAIEALKKSKPYLFKASDGNPTTPPPGAPAPNLKNQLINPNQGSESAEDRITRGFETSMRKK
jgi:hypothetical protein